jgi:hypothetical protein
MFTPGREAERDPCNQSAVINLQRIWKRLEWEVRLIRGSSRPR